MMWSTWISWGRRHAERRAKIRRHPITLRQELSPRDSNHAPAGGDETPIALAVILEGAGGAVDRPAVELDDQAGPAPYAIRLEHRSPTLSHTFTSGDGSRWSSMKARKRLSSSLRGTSRPTRPSARIARTAAAPRRPRWRSTKSMRETASPSRRISASSIAVARRCGDGREVEERAGHARHGNAVTRFDFVGGSSEE
jgi:hypothetical protein